MNIEPVNDQKVALALKRFLLIKQCPEPWKSLDLYVFRDEEVVFLVQLASIHEIHH
jgi:hypothetical protein